MASVADVEHSLSRARLELMSKRKEVRDVVHRHYGDLIGVSDHAVCMSEHIDSLSNTFSKMLSLTKALRVRLATSQLSNDLELASEPVISSSNSIFNHVDSILSLNGRVLLLAAKLDFSALSRIFTEEVPFLRTVSVPPEIKSLCDCELSVFSADKIANLCVSSMRLPMLHTKSQLVACIELLRVVSPEKLEEYWDMRSLCLEELQSDLSTTISIFDVSLSAAKICGLSSSYIFTQRFGSGLVGPRFFKECSQLQLADIHMLVDDAKNKWDPATIEFLPIDSVVEAAVDRVVMEVAPMDLDRPEWSKLVFETAIAGIDSKLMLKKSVEKNLHAKFSTLVLTRSGWLHVATHLNELLSDYDVQDLLDSVLVFYFETFKEDWLEKLREKTMLNDGFSPSGPILSVLMDMCSYPVNSIVSKRILTDLLVNHFVYEAPNMQNLLDLHFLTLVSYSVDSDRNHLALVEKVLPQVEEQVLHDLVERRLHSEPIRQAAKDALYAARGLLRPLLEQNPAAVAMEAPPEREEKTIKYLGTTVKTPFPTLPVAKAKPTTKATKVSGVTSFFNQVGKITLGSKQ